VRCAFDQILHNSSNAAQVVSGYLADMLNRWRLTHQQARFTAFGWADTLLGSPAFYTSTRTYYLCERFLRVGVSATWLLVTLLASDLMRFVGHLECQRVGRWYFRPHGRIVGSAAGYFPSSETVNGFEMVYHPRLWLRLLVLMLELRLITVLIGLELEWRTENSPCHVYLSILDGK